MSSINVADNDGMRYRSNILVKLRIYSGERFVIFFLHCPTAVSTFLSYLGTLSEKGLFLKGGRERGESPFLSVVRLPSLFLAAMETLQQLPNESFSYRWLMNGGDGDGGAFIEIDPRLASLRRDMDSAHEIDFGLCGSQFPSLASADQIFSEGLILPLDVAAPPKRSSSDSEDSVLSRSISLDSSSMLISLSKRHRSSRQPSVLTSPYPLEFSSKRKQERISKKILLYLCFFLPLYKRMKGMKLRWRPRGSSAVVPATPFASSPRPRDDFGVEKSIQEAVLYCKNSIGESRLLNF